MSHDHANGKSKRNDRLTEMMYSPDTDRVLSFKPDGTPMVGRVQSVTSTARGQQREGIVWTELKSTGNGNYTADTFELLITDKSVMIAPKPGASGRSAVFMDTESVANLNTYAKAKGLNLVIYADDSFDLNIQSCAFNVREVGKNRGAIKPTRDSNVTFMATANLHVVDPSMRIGALDRRDNRDLPAALGGYEADTERLDYGLGYCRDIGGLVAPLLEGAARKPTTDRAPR